MPARQRWSELFARFERERRAREERLVRRRAQAYVLARLLIERFSARRVVLFGSLARGEPDGRLDIDLAVAGLARGDELAALAALSEEAGCDVDLVRFEDAPPRLVAAIARDGVTLDER